MSSPTSSLDQGAGGVAHTKRLAYLHLAPGSALPPMSARRPFRAIVIAEQMVSPVWQSSVSDWLVHSGCLYMMAWGADCSAWDDAVDWAILQVFDYGDIPDDQFVMTTWHTDETLDEVFRFAESSSAHPTIELDETLLVHIANEASEQTLLAAYREAIASP
ncbi:DUF7684 family protein [Pseudomonas sp. CGJS7]|uniref:DUF7684 family protein n=1 Tax=Pseudomonas sp. CGJS7 TaxID=3109348 RepID=UPI003008CB64